MEPEAERRRSRYADKLRDPRWQKVRLQVFERDDWTCQACGSNEAPLAVHHLYYVAEREPWDLPLTAFVTLCEVCHSYEYDERPKAEGAILRALREKGFRVDALRELALGLSRLSLVDFPNVVAAAFAWVLALPDVQQLIVNSYLEHVRSAGADNYAVVQRDARGCCSELVQMEDAGTPDRPRG